MQRIILDVEHKQSYIPINLVEWTVLKNSVQQLPNVQSLLAKYALTTVMYELKEYQMETMPNIIRRESFLTLGTNYPTFLYIMDNRKNLKMMLSNEQSFNHYLPSMYQQLRCMY